MAGLEGRWSCGADAAALAPGIGDPDEFSIDDCSTQRNLSDEGRDQARRIGDRFRAHGIAVSQVYSSQWCRCRETAKLLGLGEVVDLPITNSFFQRAGRRGSQTTALRQWLAANRSTGNLVIVMHQVNISALTDRYTSSGEMVILRVGENVVLQIVGSIETD